MLSPARQRGVTTNNTFRSPARTGASSDLLILIALLSQRPLPPAKPLRAFLVMVWALGWRLCFFE